MINDFKEIIEEAVKNYDLNGFSNKKVKQLIDKYNISEKTIYNRFRALYGTSPKKLIKQRIFPSLKLMDEVILSSSTSEEVRAKLKIPNSMFIGIYDKYYGISTFQKARLNALNKSISINYNPSRQDNRSIIYSQLLGDGSYDKKRHALTIVHGEKQLEYLKWKVSLINKGYPSTAKNVKVYTHKQGHIYGSYYTNLGNIDIPKEENIDLINLTNLGWLLWYFDDGNYSQNISICCKRNDTIRQNAIIALSTFGINAREDGVSIVLRSQEDDLLFYKNFIEPFIDDIPQCMKYKVDDIVEKVII